MHLVDSNPDDVTWVTDLAVADTENGRDVALGALCDGFVGQARAKQRIQFVRKIGSTHGCLLCRYAHDHAPVHNCQRSALLLYALPKATIAPMHKTIDKILAELMARDGLNQAELARLSNVGQPTISRILKPLGPKGIKEPTDKQVRPLASALGVTTDQLRGYAPIDGAPTNRVVPAQKSSSTGVVRDMLARSSNLPESLRQKILAVACAEDGVGAIEIDQHRPGVAGDEVWIAHYDVRAAMGGGQTPHDYPEMLQDVRVSPKHLREMGVDFKEHFHLKMVTGWGQSMAPTIKHRDPLLVDITVREFVGDGIYLFTHDEMLYIKRLQMKGPEHFRMISDNKHHDPEEIRVDDTHIQAKVLFVWNGQLV